ncbi:hypothetical protein [Metabacillus fastidiosus]|uniref:hypothetical protein n=1 Tax=Metabacillus fastidiosus TaxID=1458 RepID=UPI003D28D9A2
MKLRTLKTKITRKLKANGFQKANLTTTGVRGFHNISSGFDYTSDNEIRYMGNKPFAESNLIMEEIYKILSSDEELANYVKTWMFDKELMIELIDFEE